MDVFTAIATLVLLISSSYCLKLYIVWKRKAYYVNKLPGPKQNPLIGTTYDILFCDRKDLFGIFEKRIAQYRPLFRTWLGPIPEVHIMKPEHLEIILKSSKILDKGPIYKFLQPWLGEGLLTSTGSKWHSRRKLLTPSFHFSILENFVDIFIEKSEMLADQHLKLLADGKVFDVCPQITRCALDIICKTAMGVEVHAMSKTNSDYVSAIYEISERVTHRALTPWLIPDFIFFKTSYGKRYKHCLSVLHGFTNKVIQDRKETLKMKQNNDTNNQLSMKKKRMAFLDLLLEASDNGANLSDLDIREEVDTFMFEGHDTTTAGISWAIFLLGNHPEIQDKVFEELDGIFKNDKNRSMTMKDITEMKYLERVIKESLRLYPSVPFILRQTNEPVNIGDFEIPADCVLTLHIRDVHRDPEHFPNPLEFNPDNFLPELCQNRHPFAYVPFSAGPRNCIGQKFALLEEKAVLAAIFRRYQVKALDKPTKIKHFAELILRSQEGIKISLTPRK